MKIYLNLKFFFYLIAIILGGILKSNAQSNSLAQDANDTTIYKLVDTKAEPKYDLYAHIGDAIVYPEEALKNKIEGRIQVQFVIEKDGSISQAKLINVNNLGYGIPEEALRVVQQLPKWQAAVKNGNAVRYAVTIPIMFKLSDNLNLNEKDTSKIINIKAETGYDFTDYLKKNLVYPKSAKENYISGKIQVEFIVEKDGSISNVKVIKGEELGHGIPEEAIRVIKKMPNWIPAVVNGETVRYTYSIPITFYTEDLSKALEKDGDYKVHTKVDQVAKNKFHFQEYIKANMQYPVLGYFLKESDTLIIQFIVEKNGSISNVYNTSLDSKVYFIDEALRLIKEMPKWEPAVKNNKYVRTQYKIPIEFNYQNGIYSDEELFNAPIDTLNVKETPFKQGPYPNFNVSEFIQKNLEYPITAKENKKKGKVQVEFTVERDGSISNAKVIKGAELGHGLPEEAMRVVLKMPNWVPAVKNNQLVRFTISVPVEFKLRQSK